MREIIYLITLVLTAVLFFIDKEKTIKSIKVGINKMIKNTLIFLKMIIFVSIIISLFNDEFILKYLGEGNGIIGLFIAALIGSITIMPGFIAFPLAGVLLGKGVAYMTLAAFTNTLMMVGVVTFPLEKAYLGIKVSLIRNVISFLISILIAVIIGVVYGELI